MIGYEPSGFSFPSCKKNRPSASTFFTAKNVEPLGLYHVYPILKITLAFNCFNFDPHLPIWWVSINFYVLK